MTRPAKKKGNPRKRQSKRQVYKQNKHNDNSLVAFLVRFAYEIVTWVGIAGCFVSLAYFLSTGNYRGMLWSGIALGIAILLMFGLFADRHWFHDLPRREPQKPSPTNSRAFVAIFSIGGEPSRPTVGQTFQMVVQFVNKGQSPAKNVRAVIVTEPVMNGESPRFDYSDAKVIRVGTVFTDIPARLTVSPKKNPITNELVPVTEKDMNELSTGNMRLFVHGRIDYDDGAPNTEHWTTFCGVLTYPFNDHFQLWPEHNDTD
jgi:hypothetical protein